MILKEEQPAKNDNEVKVKIKKKYRVCFFANLLLIVEV
jgi:hypothetical protein